MNNLPMVFLVTKVNILPEVPLNRLILPSDWELVDICSSASQNFRLTTVSCCQPDIFWSQRRVGWFDSLEIVSLCLTRRPYTIHVFDHREESGPKDSYEWRLGALPPTNLWICSFFSIRYTCLLAAQNRTMMEERKISRLNLSGIKSFVVKAFLFREKFREKTVPMEQTPFNRESALIDKATKAHFHFLKFLLYPYTFIGLYISSGIRPPLYYSNSGRFQRKYGCPERNFPLWMSRLHFSPGFTLFLAEDLPEVRGPASPIPPEHRSRVWWSRVLFFPLWSHSWKAVLQCPQWELLPHNSNLSCCSEDGGATISLDRGHLCY